MVKKLVISDQKTQETLEEREKTYLNALTALENIKQAEPYQIFQSQIDGITNQVQALKDNEPIEDLSSALLATVALLEQKISIDGYKKIANKMQGKRSLGLQILGGLMLGLAISIVAVFIVAGIVALITGGPTALTVAGGALAAAVVIEPVLSSMSAFGLFESKRTGLCDAMHKITGVSAVL